MLGKTGLPALAVVVLATLVVLPAMKLAVILSALFGARLSHPPRWLAWVFGCLDHLSPWAMLEVFLLGSFVAYTRIRSMAAIEVGTAMYALGGAMLALVAVDATLDREAIWQELAPDRERGSSRCDARRLLGCHECGKVARSEHGDRCPRCLHVLHRRKTNSLARAWAFALTALVLYIPANVFPAMTIEQTGRRRAHTILNGVYELAHDHMWPLALLVLLASVVVPVMKLVSLGVMLVMTHRRSGVGLVARTRLFRFVRAVGRWSMIDIFMLASLVGVVRFGAISTVLPGTGAVAFCAVVISTMLATEMFDPRLMWDAGGIDDETLLPEAAPS
jgi:paraquat-inducible protein A